MVTGAQARGPHINSLPCRVQSHGRVLRWGKGGAWGVQARAGALHAPAGEVRVAQSWRSHQDKWVGVGWPNSSLEPPHLPRGANLLSFIA